MVLISEKLLCFKSERFKNVVLESVELQHPCKGVAMLCSTVLWVLANEIMRACCALLCRVTANGDVVGWCRCQWNISEICSATRASWQQTTSVGDLHWTEYTHFTAPRWVTITQHSHSFTRLILDIILLVVIGLTVKCVYRFRSKMI